MVSLTYQDEHVAWQQRVQKEINEAFKSQNSHPPIRPCFDPPKPRSIHPSHKPRPKSAVYSSFPTSNINLSSLNVYAEVRGKYNRNANKTLNLIPQVAGIVARPATAGSLTPYSRRGRKGEVGVSLEKEKKVEERALNEEFFRVRTGNREIEEKEEEVGREGVEGKDEEVEKEVGSEEGREREEDRDTEESGKSYSSTMRYIEELEKMLREEKLRRIKAEERLERIKLRRKRKASV